MVVESAHRFSFVGPWVVIFIRSLSLNLATWGVHDFEDKGNLVKVAGSAAAGVWTPKDVLTPIDQSQNKESGAAAEW